eukprot:jgi/Mesen1/1346/ME000013S00841
MASIVDFLLTPSNNFEQECISQECKNYWIYDDGKFSCITVPSDYASLLCFENHREKTALDLTTEACCGLSAAHVHAHVHRGEIEEDLVLEKCQVCEETGRCALPMGGGGEGEQVPSLLPSSSASSPSSECPAETAAAMDIRDHMHEEGCGHEQIAHGDHFDWLLPMDDGSFALRHAHTVTGGGSHFHDHGRLVRVGAAKGTGGGGIVRRRKRQQCFDVFNFQNACGGSRQGRGERLEGGAEERRQLLPQEGGERRGEEEEEEEEDGGGQGCRAVEALVLKGPRTDGAPACAVVSGFAGEECRPRHVHHPASPALPPPVPVPGLLPPVAPAAQTAAALVEVRVAADADVVAEVAAVSLTIPDGGHVVRTVLDVMGICCPGEIPLIRRILEPMPGVAEVAVHVASKTTVVMHDPLRTSELQMVRALNEARLDASVHVHGHTKRAARWPSPHTLASGVLLLLSLFHYLCAPLKYVALAAIAVGGPPMAIRALRSLRRFVVDIHTLMLVAVVGAVGLGDYVEAATVVFLFSLAEWLESRSSEKARAALDALMALSPSVAVLAATGEEVPVEDVPVGARLAVRPGAAVPIDGTVTRGASAVDESSLTGESVPVLKEAGAEVWAGTINTTGYLEVETNALAQDSTVARMVRLVEDAQAQRSVRERQVDAFAKVYTPVVLVVAACLAVVPVAIGSDDARHFAYLALVLVVGACPCALVLSTPVVTACGLARAARGGVLIKGGAHLETLGRLTALAMDKTGTLTQGLFQVAHFSALDESSNVSDILFCGVISQWAWPLAKGRSVHASKLEAWAAEGGTIGWVGVDGVPLGIFSVADQLRREAPEALASLAALGIRVVMLTGDSVSAAQAAARQLARFATADGPLAVSSRRQPARGRGPLSRGGAAPMPLPLLPAGAAELEVHAQLLPQDKVELVARMCGVACVGMVGDGINDAPALARAHLGVAVGGGGGAGGATAVAMETADVALLSGDLRQLAAAVRLGRRCRAVVRLNLAFALATKAAVLGLAFAGYASLLAAVLVDVGSSLAVVLHSLTILGGQRRAAAARPPGGAGSEGQCLRASCCEYDLSDTAAVASPKKERAESGCCASGTCVAPAVIQAPAKSTMSSCCAGSASCAQKPPGGASSVGQKQAEESCCEASTCGAPGVMLAFPTSIQSRCGSGFAKVPCGNQLAVSKPPRDSCCKGSTCGDPGVASLLSKTVKSSCSGSVGKPPGGISIEEQKLPQGTCCKNKACKATGVQPMAPQSERSSCGGGGLGKPPGGTLQEPDTASCCKSRACGSPPDGISQSSCTGGAGKLTGGTPLVELRQAQGSCCKSSACGAPGVTALLPKSTRSSCMGDAEKLPGGTIQELDKGNRGSARKLPGGTACEQDEAEEDKGSCCKSSTTCVAPAVTQPSPKVKRKEQQQQQEEEEEEEEETRFKA